MFLYMIKPGSLIAFFLNLLSPAKQEKQQSLYVIPAFLFSQLSVCSHYLGVNWAYWCGSHTLQTQYLSRFIYLDFSSSGTTARP